MKSTARVNYLGSEGLVQSVSKGSWDFIYRTSTVKDSKWNIGDRVILPDGREYRYGFSTAALSPDKGCEFAGTGYTGYTALAVAATKGDTELTIAAATHATLTEDYLTGGFVTIYGDADGHEQFRGIVGNQAVAADLAFKIYLDGPISANLVAGTAATETWENPYALLALGSNAGLSKAGIPAVYVSAASMYFWVQTKGPVWVPPQTSNVGENGGRGCFWRHDATLEGAEIALGGLTVPAGDTSQYAGFVLGGAQADNGPLFMLT